MTREIKFAICACQTGEKLKKWQEIANILANTLGQKVNLITFNSLQEEEKFVKSINWGKEYIHLYYSDSSIGFFLWEKGYVPIGQFPEKKDRLVIISKRDFNPNKPLKVALGRRKFMFLALSYLPSLHSKLQLMFTYSHADAVNKLLESKDDVAVVPESIIEGLDEETKGNIKILTKTDIYDEHYLWIHPELEQKYHSHLKEFAKETGLELISPDRKDKLFSLFYQVRHFIKAIQSEHILKHIQDIPGIILAIYQEAYVYANDYFLKSTGYTLEELRKLKPEDLVLGKDIKEIREIINRRLKGEKFEIVYKDIKFKTKINRMFYAVIFTNTIVYDGEYAGLIVGLDITQRKRVELIKEVLNKVHTMVSESATEKDLYKAICKTLVETLGLELALIGEIDKEVNGVSIIEAKGPALGYIYGIRIKDNDSLIIPDKATVLCYEKREVVINEDTTTNKLMEPNKTQALNHGLLSSACIPIIKDGEVVKVIGLYSKEAYFFVEEIKELLKEVSNIVSWALYKLEILRSQKLLLEAVEKVPYFLLITDDRGIIKYSNNMAEKKLGAKKGSSLCDVLPIAKELLEKIDFKTRSPVRTYLDLSGSSKKVHCLEVLLYPILIYEDQRNIMVFARDITREVSLSQEVERLRTHDALTGLLSEYGFIMVAQGILIDQPDQKAALLLINLHGLQKINSAYGYEVGDYVLRQVARRLRASVKNQDLVARIHGDIFGVLLLNLPNKNLLVRIVSRILREVFASPIYKNGKKLFVSYHAGVALYPEDGKDIYTLLKHASAAADAAKSLGENQLYFFNEELKHRLDRYLSAEKLVLRAIEKDLFTLFYQPVYRTTDLSIYELEALIRIIDEEGNIHFPYEFIEYLENSVFARDFEQWLIREAVDKAKRWNIPISVNMSAKSFMEEDFKDLITNNVPLEHAKNIVIEITERHAMKDPERAKKIIDDCKMYYTDRGYEPVKFALDDFGTGYNSLLYLKNLAVDILKIDRSFIMQIEADRKIRDMVEIMINIAHTFDMQSLAEGVETREQLQLLKSIGCDLVQGFLLAKPMPEDELTVLLRK
ncbi:signal transduction protein [Thermosulfidibacter takaii ABI70S6]|uniref:Signal transduction protein n=1 Tax=Thermosulfidibacter takaii (strain DSM 17441 / JCM 13301 / NBRC 103674 / ABI70S6) TaxID=1298851 RepID=A0A0S3QUB5_THET7|nr:EAL domain-containing protein [Thermosulfidibacter takaii]BAT71912.1 signal transduction protein [Thermosulfidibacter takaii ABI70S6]